MEKQFDKENLNDLILNNKIPDGWDFAYQLTYNDLSKIIENMYALNQPSSSIVNIVDILTDHHEYVGVIKKTLQILREKFRGKLTLKMQNMLFNLFQNFLQKITVALIHQFPQAILS